MASYLLPPTKKREKGIVAALSLFHTAFFWCAGSHMGLEEEE